jgi:hypothetical membrane protein
MQVLMLCGVAAPVLFGIVTIVCAALRPDYSHIHHFISELGATGTSHAWLMNYVGFVPSGIMLAVFGASTAGRLPRHGFARLASGLIILFGAGVALSGLFSCDIGCPQTGGSVENAIHDRLAPLTFLAGSLGAASMGVIFRRLPQLRPLWVYSVVSGALGLGLLAAVASTLETRELTGLWQRLLLAVLLGWCAVVALRLHRIDTVGAHAVKPPY